MPHFMQAYETSTRACFAVMDDYGNLTPCTRAAYLFVAPHHQLLTNWGTK